MDREPTLGAASTVLAAVAALGCSSLLVQLALMREWLGAFQGNELTLAAVLGNWLLLSGAGAALGRRADRFARPLRALYWAQLVVAVVPLAQVLAIRLLRNELFLRGAALSPTQAVASTFVVLGPFCLVSGFMLALACSLESRAMAASGGIARVYVADSCGSVAGGVLFSAVLVHWLDHVALVSVAALFNLSAASLLGWRLGRATLVGLPVACGLALLTALLTKDIDALSTAWQLRPQRVVFRANSPYGRLVITETAGQLNVIQNGLPVFSTESPEQAEEAVHPAMAQRPGARRVLLISGGITGATVELLKYPNAAITYVELDPLIVEAAERFFTNRFEDPRIDLVSADGRRFIGQTTNRYDVVLVCAPDPSTYQLNRFYTLEFFERVKRVLRPDGVLAFSLGRYENFVSDDLARLVSSASRTVRRPFPNLLLLPLGQVVFLASTGDLTADIAGVLEERGIATRFVRRSYLQGMLTPGRLADLERAASQPAKLNEDLYPTLYFYHVRHWMGQFDARLALFLGGLGGLGLLLYVSRLRAVTGAVFASGFAAATLEVVLLLGFQALYGSVYREVGMLVTVFMAGLAVGGWLGYRVGTVRSRGVLGWVAGFIALLAWAIPHCLGWLGETNAGGTGRVFVLTLTFALAAAVGSQFPLAGKIDLGGASRTASRLYTADFVGACAGAFLGGAILIPLIGVGAVCWLTAGLNAAAAVCLLARRPVAVG